MIIHEHGPKRYKYIFINTTFTTLSSYSLPKCEGTNPMKWNNCKGTLTFPNGDKYIGEFKDGKKHGKGTSTWDNGLKHVGEYKNGKRHGKGTQTFSDGEKWVGKYKSFYKHGKKTNKKMIKIIKINYKIPNLKIEFL